MTFRQLTAEQQRRDVERKRFVEIEREIAARPKPRVTRGRKPTIIQRFIKPKDISAEALKEKQILVRKWEKKDLPKWVTDFMGDPLKLSDSDRKLVLPFYGKSSADALKQKSAMTSYLNRVAEDVKKNPAKAALFAALPPGFKMAGRGIRATGITKLITRIPHGETISKRSLQLVSTGLGAVYSKDIYNRVTEPVFTVYKEGETTTSQRTLPNGDIEITTTTEQIPQYRKPTGPEQHERIGGIFATELLPLGISQRIISRGVKIGYKPQPKPKPKVKVTTTIKRAGEIIKTTKGKIKTLPSKIKTKAEKAKEARKAKREAELKKKDIKVKSEAQKAKEARAIKKRHEKAAKEAKTKRDAELKKLGVKPKTKKQLAKERSEIKKRHEKAEKELVKKEKAELKRLGLKPKTKKQLAKEHAIMKKRQVKAEKTRLKEERVEKHTESARRLNTTRYNKLKKIIYNLNRSLDKLEKLIHKAIAIYGKLTLKERKQHKKELDKLKRHMKNVRETRTEVGALDRELAKAKKHHDTRIKPSVRGKKITGPRVSREVRRQRRLKEERFDREVKRLAEEEFNKKLAQLEKQEKYLHSQQGRMDAAIEFTEMTASNWGRTFKLIEPLPKPLPKGTYIVKGMIKAEKHAILKVRGEKAARERAKIRAAELKARDKKIKTPEEVKKEHAKMRAALVKAGKIKIETKKLPAKKRVAGDQETSKIIKTQTESGTVMLERVKTKVRQHEKAVHATAKEATKTKVKKATKTKLKQIESRTRTQHKQLTTLYKSMAGLGVTYGALLKVANTQRDIQKIRTNIKTIQAEKDRISELITELITVNQLVRIGLATRFKTTTTKITRTIPKFKKRVIPPRPIPVIIPRIPTKVPAKKKKKKKVKKVVQARYIKNPVPSIKAFLG